MIESRPSHRVTQGCQENTQSRSQCHVMCCLYCSKHPTPGGNDFPMEGDLYLIVIPNLIWAPRPLLGLLHFFLFSFSFLRTSAPKPCLAEYLILNRHLVNEYMGAEYLPLTVLWSKPTLLHFCLWKLSPANAMAPCQLASMVASAGKRFYEGLEGWKWGLVGQGDFIGPVLLLFLSAWSHYCFPTGINWL